MTNYPVGYGKPPKETRFRRGRSGNPAGRSKGSRNLATDIEAEFNEPHVVMEEGRPRTITKQRALVKNAVSRGIESKDVRAPTKALELKARHCPESSNSDEDIGAHELEIFQRCAPRLLKSLNPNQKKE